MGRANRGKIKERLTEERKSNRELKEKVKQYETRSIINKYKFGLFVGLICNIAFNDFLSSGNVTHMAIGCTIGAIILLLFVSPKID